MNLILAIDTSCDETSVAVTCGRRVLSNVISSQINIHKKYGGVYPALAKRAHEERIGLVIREAVGRAERTLKWEDRSEKLDNEVGSGKIEDQKISPPTSTSSFPPPTSHFHLSAIAVTQGPGLAIALEVGIRKAKEIIRDAKIQRYKDSKIQRCIDEMQRRDVKTKNFETLKPANSAGFSASPRLIAVNHLEGHIYSCLAQNSQGHPVREITFPALCLLVSGGHTQLVLMKDHGKYQVLGATLDDACGEALDKAAKILKLGYPGGPIIERLAEEYINKKWGMGSGKLDPEVRSGKEKISPPTPKSNLPPPTSHFKYSLSQPLKDKSNLNFSYSGLKTQFLYLVENMSEKELGQSLYQLAFFFQEAAFEQLIRKTSQAITVYQPKTLIGGGGVIANKYLRKLLRQLARKNNLPVLFPPFKNLITDNAAMIGVAAYYKLQRKEFVKDIESLDREPRLQL